MHAEFYLAFLLKKINGKSKKDIPIFRSKTRLLLLLISTGNNKRADPRLEEPEEQVEFSNSGSGNDKKKWGNFYRQKRVLQVYTYNVKERRSLYTQSNTSWIDKRNPCANSLE